MSAFDPEAEAARLVTIRATGKGWVIEGEGEWGGIANTVSPRFAVGAGKAMRDDIATALRSAHAAGRAEALAEVVRHLRSAGLPVADFIERGDHLRTWAVKS